MWYNIIDRIKSIDYMTQAILMLIVFMVYLIISSLYYKLTGQNNPDNDILYDF